MRNITIKVDDEVARWAEVWAARQDSSVSKLLSDLLKTMMADEDRYEEAARSFLSRGGYALRDSADESYPSRDDLYGS